MGFTRSFFHNRNIDLIFEYIFVPCFVGICTLLIIKVTLLKVLYTSFENTKKIK